MTALLTADEAARLRVGVNVIVRPGAQPTCQQPSERDDGTLCGSDYEVSLVDVVRYEGEGESTFFHLPICYGHRLALAEHVIAYESAPVVAPQAWVALTGPCPPGCIDAGIVPLYTECPACAGVGRHFTQTVNDDHATRQCEKCRGEFIVLVGRASIAVVPVVTYGEWEIAASPTPGITIDDYGHAIYMFRGEGDGAFGFPLTLDPLPVSGRDWGILIDCIEVV